MTDSNPQCDLAPAPHGLRLGAWLIDCVFVAILLLPLPYSISNLGLICLFIAYHTTLLWLLNQTLGKALLGLKVARAGKPSGLLWAFGRSSVGYFVVDLVGIGMLSAFFDRRHRALHDYVFRSVVVLDESGPLTLKTLVSRFLSFAERQLTEAKRKKRLIGIVGAFWAFHIGLAKSVLKTLDFLSSIGAGAPSTSSVPSLAGVLSAKAIVGIVTVTTAIITTVVTSVPGLRPMYQWLNEPVFSMSSVDSSMGKQRDIVTITQVPTILTARVQCSELENKLCRPSYSVGLLKRGLLKIRYFVGEGHCAPIKLHLFADGGKVHTTEILKWPGATNEFSKYALNTGVVVLDNLADGNHAIELQAEGVPGGCATDGEIQSWGGQVEVWTSISESGKSRWQFVSDGDCSGRDSAIVLPTHGEIPLPANCSAARAGSVAVCWDGRSYVNPSKQNHWSAWCTYKDVSPNHCQGGRTLGRMFVCP